MVESSRRQATDRPYPWQCPVCLKPEVVPTTLPYTARVKHDGAIHEVPVAGLEVPRCRSCGELVFSQRVDDQINAALRAQLHLLTPEQIQSGRRKFGLDQQGLAEQLGVAPETVSGWESGALIPTRAMDNLLRLFFALPEVRAVLAGKGRNPNLGVVIPTPV